MAAAREAGGTAWRQEPADRGPAVVSQTSCSQAGAEAGFRWHSQGTEGVAVAPLLRSQLVERSCSRRSLVGLVG